MAWNYFKSFFLTLVIAIIVVAPFCAHAAVITIKNDDSANVDIVIEPGEGSIISRSNQIKQTIKPKEEQKIEVTKEAMGSSDTFSVTGKVRMPSLYNKCGPLFIDKDYKIIFVGSKAGGTICIAESVK